MQTDTRQLIAAINDEGTFERLAGSTLRIDDSIYQGLCETGTNPKGRTIPDPADGIIYTENELKENYAIIIHHTITPRSKLRSKWLTSETADIKKAMEVFDASKDELKNYKKRIVLTCSTGPNSQLVTDIEKFSKKKDVEIHIWTGARIADVLDIKADGQWLRARTFGTPQQRLSIDLVKDIATRMVEDVRPQSDPAEYIERHLKEKLSERLTGDNCALFLSGRSGIGKSVLCYDFAKEIERNDGVCLVVSDDILGSSVSINEALKKSFARYAPNIAEEEFQETLLSLFGNRDVVLWIEDINRAASPTDLLRKIIRWSKPSSSSSNDNSSIKRSVKFLCPVWQEIIGGLSESESRTIAASSVLLDEYSPSEGGNAVLARAKNINRQMTDLQAQELADILNYDPLLIGLLSDWNKTNPQEIIEEYIENEVRSMAVNGTHHNSEIKEALHELSGSMLQHRNMSPSWPEAMDWTSDSNRKDILRRITKESSLVSINDHGRLNFRHDRIRDFLSASWVANQMENGILDSSFLNDPFFARIMGEAVLKLGSQNLIISHTKKLGTLAKTHAFANAVRQSHSERETIFRLCKEDLCSSSFKDGPVSEKWAVNVVLASLDGQDVLELLSVSSERCFVRQEGMARNGNVRAASAFCYYHDPFTTSPRRDHLIKHLNERYGEKWVSNLGELIKSPETEGRILTGALNLAGELGHAALIDPLKLRWQAHLKSSQELSAGILFASITCAAGRENDFLEEVIRHWSLLPEDDEEREHRNQRYDVAAYSLTGGLKRHENDRVIDYVLSIPSKYRELRNVVTTTLKAVDHPKAVTHVAEEVANVDRRCEGSGGFNLWGTSFTDNWGRMRHRYYRKMSSDSRDALNTLWKNQSSDIWLRKRSFDLWSAWMPREDIAYLKELPPKGLEDRALAARLRHRDQTAKRELSEKILAEDDHSYWLHFARYVGTHGLEETITELFHKRRRFFQEQPDGHFPQDDILPELLGDRDDEFSYSLLKENWDQITDRSGYTTNCYIIAMLYLATPESVRLAEMEIAKTDDPKDIFKYLDMRMGIKTTNRPGLTKLTQIEAILPYFDYLGDLSKWSIWENCNTRGWYEWRRKHLDEKFEFPEDRTFPRVNKQADFEWLDKQLNIENRRDIEARYWSKDRIECGISTAELVDRAQEYANLRKTPIAYKFFSDVMAQHGLRSDLSKLEIEWALTDPLCVASKEQSCFSIMLRSCV